MNLDVLGRFFFWCSVINLGCSLVAFVMVTAARKFVSKVHSMLFGVPEEKAVETIYSGMTMYKTFIFVFNIIPYIAIQIIK